MVQDSNSGPLKVILVTQTWSAAAGGSNEGFDLEYRPKDELLARLNSVLGTARSLDQPGLRECLIHVLRNSRDFGVAYGTLRQWWSYDFTEVLNLMEQRRMELERIRSNALRGSCIISSAIPPRRIWDLYSNRVLPFHVVPQKANQSASSIPDSIWTVSHSWVSPEDRHDVWTTINGKQWPVSTPCMTTLVHVRVELLNMGAECVWVDVLCLRQKGGESATNAGSDLSRDVAETQQSDEWRLDIPTIGNIYQRGAGNVPCITYFNGLGLPLDPSSAVLSSPRHWYNRVWTLQETCDSWLPGGLVPNLFSHYPRFTLRTYPLNHPLFDNIKSTVAMGHSELASLIKNRSCTTELDRIAGLAYLLGCATLPVYNDQVPVESAWGLLLKHIPDDTRTG